MKWDDYGVDDDLTTTPSKPAKFPRNRDPPTEMPPVGTKSHNGTTFAILSLGDKTEVLLLTWKSMVIFALSLKNNNM